MLHVIKGVPLSPQGDAGVQRGEDEDVLARPQVCWWGEVAYTPGEDRSSAEEPHDVQGSVPRADRHLNHGGV